MFDPSTAIIQDAKVTFLGVEFNTTGDIKDKPDRASETVTLGDGSRYAMTNGQGFDISVPIVGTIPDMLRILQLFYATRFGRALAPSSFVVSALDLSSDVLTVNNHPFTTGDAVTPRWDETGPTASGGFAKHTAVWVHVIDSNTFTLHRSQADANANTNKINFTAAGIGDLLICGQLTLKVSRRAGGDGVARTYKNVAIMKLPTITLAGGKRFFSGELVFRAYPALGSVPTDGAAAFYTETTEAFTSPSWDATKILGAQQLTIQTDGASPWDNIANEMGVELSFEPQVKPQASGVWPRASDQMSGFKVTAKIVPLGFGVSDYAALVNEVLGKQLKGVTLFVYDGLFDWFLYGATLVSTEAVQFSYENRVLPALTFEALRNPSAPNYPPYGVALD